MKKILSLFLSAVMVLVLLPSSAFAMDVMTISPQGAQMIASFEGFHAMPYEDRGKWYIGYGLVCNPDDYPFGITENEAYQLMVEDLKDKEDAVNGLLHHHNIRLNQQQFDALMSLTYTLGHQWMNPSYRLCSYLINGIQNYSEIEVVNAFATWCHVGTEPLGGLVDRRLTEAFLFLYGSYENPGEEMYRYIHFRPDGGEVENRTVFYPVGQPYGVLPVPDGKGRTFLGWYTEDGAMLTGMELANENINVTAHWEGEETEKKDPSVDISKWVNPYADVQEKDWYYGYVRELSANGVVNGNPDGTFQPESHLKAGEALKLILLAAGYEPQEPQPGTHWASGYLTLAENLGCVAPGEIADLNGEISRLIIARVAAIAMGAVPSYGTNPFVDANDGYTLTLYEEGIVTGTIVGRQRFYYPDDGIKRSEVCAIVSRILNWEPDPGAGNDPSQTGYIYYRHAESKYLPVIPNVPRASYDPNLFVKNESTMYYNGPGYMPAIGIDVSSHQGEIDWQQVAQSGVEFAFIRVGFRGYGEEGKVNLDKYFLDNLTAARNAGIRVGVYFFSQAINVGEAIDEANFVLENLAGVPLDYPVVFDWEPVRDRSARTNGLDVRTLTDCAIAFSDTVARAGYMPMIYYNTPVAYMRYDLSRLTQYDVWYAQYAQRPTIYYDYRIWQYTSSGSVPGISTRVDMNIAMIPY